MQVVTFPLGSLRPVIKSRDPPSSRSGRASFPKLSLPTRGRFMHENPTCRSAWWAVFQISQSKPAVSRTLAGFGSISRGRRLRRGLDPPAREVVVEKGLVSGLLLISDISLPRR